MHWLALLRQFWCKTGNTCFALKNKISWAKRESFAWFTQMIQEKSVVACKSVLLP